MATLSRKAYDAILALLGKKRIRAAVAVRLTIS